MDQTEDRPGRWVCLVRGVAENVVDTLDGALPMALLREGKAIGQLARVEVREAASGEARRDLWGLLQLEPGWELDVEALRGLVRPERALLAPRVKVGPLDEPICDVKALIVELPPVRRSIGLAPRPSVEKALDGGGRHDVSQMHLGLAAPLPPRWFLSSFAPRPLVSPLQEGAGAFDEAVRALGQDNTIVMPPGANLEILWASGAPERCDASALQADRNLILRAMRGFVPRRWFTHATPVPLLPAWVTPPAERWTTIVLPEGPFRWDGPPADPIEDFRRIVEGDRAQVAHEVAMSLLAPAVAAPSPSHLCHAEGRRARVAGLQRQQNPYSHARDVARFAAWEGGYLAVSANPTLEPGWVHTAGCMCGRCDGRGGYKNPEMELGQ